MRDRLKDKGRVMALGTMSGTSLDGVDAAVLETDGEEILWLGESAYRPYSPHERGILRAGLGKWPGDTGVAQAAEVVELAHAELISGFSKVDLIGFHGQTLAHDPSGGRTHQVGNGEILAEVLNRPVVWDFRSADMNMGGQGAPLAPAYHFALAKWIGADAPVAFLNLGGVGNVTWVDPSCDNAASPGAVLAFDTGPANAPINDLMQARLSITHDEHGKMAAQGAVDEDVLNEFASLSYFMKVPPKSLDRDAFAGLSAGVSELSTPDAAATLTAAAAAAVMQAEQHFPRPATRLLVCGGGRHNPVLMDMIAASVSCPVVPVEDVGLNGDMLEAQAFAYLAVRVLKGLPTSFPGTTGVAAAVGGGTLSYPQGL